MSKTVDNLGELSLAAVFTAAGFCFILLFRYTHSWIDASLAIVMALLAIFIMLSVAMHILK